MSNFVETLKSLMTSHNLNITSLSKCVGISSSQISKYVSGNYEPSLNNAIKISNYFDCSLDYLFGIDEIVKRYELGNVNIPQFKTRLANLIDLRKTNINRISKNTYTTRNCIYEWLHLDIIPKTSILAKLAIELSTSIEYLIGRTDNLGVER